jgi:hypothetical protein
MAEFGFPTDDSFPDNAPTNNDDTGAVVFAGCYSNYWQVAPIIRPYDPNLGLFPPLLQIQPQDTTSLDDPTEVTDPPTIDINEPTGPSLYDLVHPTFEDSPNQYALEPHLLVQFLSSIIRNIGPDFHGGVDHPCPHFYWMQYQGNWYSFFHHFNSLNRECVLRHVIDIHRNGFAPISQYDRFLFRDVRQKLTSGTKLFLKRFNYKVLLGGRQRRYYGCIRRSSGILYLYHIINAAGGLDNNQLLSLPLDTVAFPRADFFYGRIPPSPVNQRYDFNPVQLPCFLAEVRRYTSRYFTDSYLRVSTVRQGEMITRCATTHGNNSDPLSKQELTDHVLSRRSTCLQFSREDQHLWYILYGWLSGQANDLLHPSWAFFIPEGYESAILYLKLIILMSESFDAIVEVEQGSRWPCQPSTKRRK